MLDSTDIERFHYGRSSAGQSWIVDSSNDRSLVVERFLKKPKGQLGETEKRPFSVGTFLDGASRALPPPPPG